MAELRAAVDESGGGDPYSVSGVARSKLLEVRCMGTPMLVPLGTAKMVPLLASRLQSPWYVNTPGWCEAPTTDVDVPLSVFMRVLEACVKGNKSDASDEDLGRFLVDDLDQFLPPIWLPDMHAKEVGSENGSQISYYGTKCFVHRRLKASEAFGKCIEDKTEDVLHGVTMTARASSFFMPRRRGDGVLEYDLPRRSSLDVVERFEMQFSLARDETRREPLADDFLTTMLFRSIELETVGGWRITQSPAWAVWARHAAMQNWRENEKAAGIFKYASLSYDKKLALTRRGFTVTLTDLFPNLLLILHIITCHVIRIRVNLPSCGSPFVVTRDALTVYTREIADDGHRDRVTRGVNVGTYEEAIFSESHGCSPIHFVNRPVYAILFTLEDDAAWFDRVTLAYDDSETNVEYTYDQLRYDNWKVAGFKQPPPCGFGRNVFCFALSTRFWPENALAANFIEKNLKLNVHPSTTRVADVTWLCFNLLRHGNGQVCAMLN